MGDRYEEITPANVSVFESGYKAGIEDSGDGDIRKALECRTTERNYHQRMADKLSEVIRSQKVEIASRDLRITGLEETLKDAERFMAYFAEGQTSFEGPGTPQSCLAAIRRILPRTPQGSDANG